MLMIGLKEITEEKNWTDHLKVAIHTQIFQKFTVEDWPTNNHARPS